MMERFEAAEWNAIIAGLPGAHVLQSWEWGHFKARTGWQALPYAWRDEGGRVVAAALVLRRTIPVKGFAARLCVLYAPKGPLLDWNDAALRQRVLADLHALGKRQRAIFVKIDPDVPLGTGVPGEAGALDDPLGAAVTADLRAAGWHFSDEQIQFRNTVLLDLRPEPEQLLANMKQKTRYNVRLAERKGVTVRAAGESDLPLLYRMYAETSVRDGFVIREQAYYLDVWSSFLRAGYCEPLVAEIEGEAVSAVVVFRFAGRAWYLHGMSRDIHREKMPAYLLQWQAMLRARAAGCTVYDLWGAPEVFDESDSMWGVYRFKEGLGGQVLRTLGAWDLPVKPVVYQLYTQVLPRLLDRMRKKGKEQTRQMVG